MRSAGIIDDAGAATLLEKNLKQRRELRLDRPELSL